MFAGWSWKFRRFDIGLFKSENGVFSLHREKSSIPHPRGEKKRSIVFIGDYRNEYMDCLANVLENRHGFQNR
jgi:hypothetical protein